LRLGQVIAGLGLPTLFVMEGGYAIAPLGQNVTNVLTGYLQS
jgi:acetoin utilization deacetylase AcuC-like enzyme